MAHAGSPELVTPSSSLDWRVSLAAVALGMTSLVTQIILLREFLSVLYGNELVIGVLLANWMLLTGLGSYAGRFLMGISRKERLLLPLLVLLATVPYVTVLLLRLLRNLVFPVGAMVGFVPIIWSSFLLLAPYCLLSGGSFSILTALFSRDDRSTIGAVYAREAMGSVAGGIVFSLILIHFLNTFQSLTVMMAVNLAGALAIARDQRTVRVVLWIVSFLLLFPSLILNIDLMSKRFLFPGQELIETKDTPYGSLTVTRQSEQENFYENSLLLASTNDVSTSEEAVHFAMLQHPAPRTVLMISGALSGAPREVLKYNVGRLDYVELNTFEIELAKRYTTSLNDRRINVINEDARLFVRKKMTPYDVVLLNTPEPGTVQANRFYTVEFFTAVKKIMNADGILSLGMLSATDYQSEDAQRINSTMMNTLQSLFKEVIIVPGAKTFFLASDSGLEIGIARLAGRRGIENTYVNKYYLDDEDLARRSALIVGSLSADAPINKDFVPVSYYRQLVHWLSYFRTNFWIVAILAAIALAGVATQLNAISAGVFTGGFAASAIEVFLLIAFQILYGYVYQLLGLIVTMFMAGLAAGSYFRRKIVRRAHMKSYLWIQCGIAVYCFLLPLVILLLRSVQDLPFIVQCAILLLTFMVGGLVGLEFSIAAALRRGDVQSVASNLYGVDLIGSALGALLVAAYLIPVLGLFSVGVIAGTLSAISALIAFANRQTYASNLE